MSRLTRWLVLIALASAKVTAHAHDALQSSTNVWLRPDQMEVEIILARAASRPLADNPPPVPVTEDNFESTYHELFQKSAPTLVEVSVDGKKIEPQSITVDLYEETDLRFDYLYPSPPAGKFSFTTRFLKRMDEGYINSLGVNEGLHMIGMDDQDSDHATWEMNIGADQDSTATPVTQLTATTASSGPVDAVIVDRAEDHVVNKNFFFNTVLICVIMLLILTGVFLKLRSKHRAKPPAQ
jgi:hypothetical protein